MYYVYFKPSFVLLYYFVFFYFFLARIALCAICMLHSILLQYIYEYFVAPTIRRRSMMMDIAFASIFFLFDFVSLCWSSWSSLFCCYLYPFIWSYGAYLSKLMKKNSYVMNVDNDFQLVCLRIGERVLWWIGNLWRLHVCYTHIYMRERSPLHCFKITSQK